VIDEVQKKKKEKKKEKKPNHCITASPLWPQNPIT